jgi:hypothetical protein
MDPRSIDDGALSLASSCRIDPHSTTTGSASVGVASSQKNRKTRAIPVINDAESRGPKPPIRVNSNRQKRPPKEAKKSAPPGPPIKKKKPPKAAKSTSSVDDDEALKEKEKRNGRLSRIDSEIDENGDEDAPKAPAAVASLPLEQAPKLEASNKKKAKNSKNKTEEAADTSQKGTKSMDNSSSRSSPRSSAAPTSPPTRSDSKASSRAASLVNPPNSQKPGAISMGGTERDLSPPQLAVPQKVSAAGHRRSLAAAAYADTETEAGGSVDSDGGSDVEYAAAADETDTTTQAQCNYLPMVMTDIDAASNISSLPEHGQSHDDDSGDNGGVPIAARLAPEEADLEARVAARLDFEMKEKLDQVLTERLQEERSGQLVAQAVQVDTTKEICGVSRKLLLALGCCIFLMVLAVVVGVTLALSTGNDDGGDVNIETTRSPSEEPIQAPSLAPTTTKVIGSDRFETLFVLIIPEIAGNSETSFLRDPETPQFQALEWLADEDPAQLDFNETPLETVLERYALAVLFFGTMGESWRDSLGFLNSTSVCEWNDNNELGVYCDAATGSVIELLLSKCVLYYSSGVSISLCAQHLTRTYLPIIVGDSSLEGTFPSELGLLARLVKIDFDVNFISGSLPAEISRLLLLERLWLNDNTLTGSIPTAIGTFVSLQSVDFGDNELIGRVPTEMVRLSLLRYLDLRSNTIRGKIPTEMGNLVAMEGLYLASNRLTGPIPTEFGSLPLVSVLDLEKNDLSGPIPSELGRLTSLTQLYVNNNRLTGVVPPEFANLENVGYFNLDATDLTGGVENLFCDRIVIPIEMFWADCDGLEPKLLCNCCTFCCDGEACMPNE